MTDAGAKAVLQRYLQRSREALLWKLEGLKEYDMRRPLTPTGTNLLGLVKHAAGTETGYFGDCFARPFAQVLPWTQDDAEPNADMWATAQESAGDVVELYRRVWRHADATLDALTLETTGIVPWWPPERREVTLLQVLVHVVAETDRHAGHADVIRELIDGSAGLRADNDNLPSDDQAWWQAYVARLQAVAETSR